MKNLFIIILMIASGMHVVAGSNSGSAYKQSVEYRPDGITISYSIVDNDLLSKSYRTIQSKFNIDPTLENDSVVPVIRDLVYLPDGYTGKIATHDVVGKEISMQTDIPNKEVLSSVIRVAGTTAYRGHNMLEIEISPIFWDKKSSRAKLATEIKYSIEFLPIDDISRRANQSVKPICKNDVLLQAVVNPETLMAEVAANSDIENTPKELLIIAPTKYEGLCSDFAAHKRLMGYKTTVLVQESWNTEDIKEGVYSWYFSAKNPSALLLVGNAADVPPDSSFYVPNITFGNTDEPLKPHITDLPYACMMKNSKDNFIPDISYGRIPADNTTQLEAVLQKIKGYEIDPTKLSSFSKVLLAGKWEDATIGKGEGGLTSITSCQRVLKKLNTIKSLYVSRQYYDRTFSKSKMYEIEGKKYTVTELKETGDSLAINISDQTIPLQNEFSLGYNIAYYSAHGSNEGWINPELITDEDHVLRKFTSNALPLIISGACKTGNFGKSVCFASDMLCGNSASNGCIGLYACTETTMSPYMNHYSEGVFDAIWPEYPIYNYRNANSKSSIPIYELGEIHKLCLFRMDERSANSIYSKAKRYMHEIIHLFGDPTVKFLNEYPTQIKNCKIERLGDSINISTDDDATISIINVKTGEINVKEGNTFSHQTPSPNECIVCVSAPNRIPTIDYPDEFINLYLQNKTYSGLWDYSNNYDNMYVGSDVNPNDQNGEVIIREDAELKSTLDFNGCLEIKPNTTIEKGARINIDFN